MANELLSSSVSNDLRKSQIDTMKIQQWIVGVMIGSVPFLFIIFCWIFVSLCLNNLVRCYQWMKNQRRYTRRRDTQKNPTQIDTV